MPDRPEDVDAAFAAIVADLEREGVGRTLPDLDDVEDRATRDAERDGKRDGGGDAPGDSTRDSGDPVPRPGATSTAPPPGWRGHEAEWDWSWGTDDDHYVPPDPPPLPRLRPLTVVALALVVAAVALLVLPGVVGLDARVGTPIALVALICGGTMLLLRIRQTPKDPDNGRDDGAQI